MAKTDLTYEHGKNLYINLTNECPCSCDFCLRDGGGSIYADNLWYGESEPTKEEFLSDLETRDLLKYEEIVFCGFGEPACRWDDMMWLCDKIKEKGSFLIRINTNGLSDLINERSTAAELDGRVDSISISLNAATPEDYDALCHSSFGLEALPAIIKFTANCVLVVPRVYMTVISTMDEEEIEACRAICKKIGAELVIREYIDKEDDMNGFIKEAGMDVLTAINTRKSIRNFTGEAIGEAELSTILRSGFNAPSARNCRPWDFIVVKNSETMAKIAEACPNMGMINRGADCCVVLCGDLNLSDRDVFLVTDCSAAAENMLLTAHALGLGGVWCHAAHDEQRAFFTELLDLPETVKSVMVLVLGHPAEKPEIPERFDEKHVHHEKYN